MPAGAVTCRLTGTVDLAVDIGDASNPSDGGIDKEAGAEPDGAAEDVGAVAETGDAPNERPDDWGCAGVEGGPTVLAAPLLTVPGADRCLAAMPLLAQRTGGVAGL